MSNFIKHKKIKTYNREGSVEREDAIAIEDPLEIQIRHPKLNEGLPKSISITMRTPGHDTDLALGFLFTEGIVRSANQIKSVHQFSENNIMVNLEPDVILNIGSLDRNFYTTSSCGVCGKASIDAIHTTTIFDIKKDDLSLKTSALYGLQQELLQHQSVFAQTGGIHAAALFDQNMAQVQLREDVGRHNALDKLIGYCFQANQLPLTGHILLLSGRASFELIQKAGMAGIPVIVAVGAPSSLAVELADDLGVTLVGFLKQDSFNVYSHAQRITS